MKNLQHLSLCVALQGKQPVPAYWHNNAATSFTSIRGTDISSMDLESEGWDG